MHSDIARIRSSLLVTLLVGAVFSLLSAEAPAQDGVPDLTGDCAVSSSSRPCATRCHATPS
jgi:hypothetical protein